MHYAVVIQTVRLLYSHTVVWSVFSETSLTRDSRNCCWFASKVLLNIFVSNVQDVLKDYLDKRERGDLLCQKRTYISDFLSRKVSTGNVHCVSKKRQ